ncbi:hypothetical protein BDV96DRAFT_508985 [Lophiotrema nucula]|uniref:Fungal STAND N-terminal Goodbye domain-containing protein n=1 Tax=Lophiotrema nucula TaxID=690887 RepID=A0A6A5YG39_9PLEO|nr:hypothetical protein BDV96DRAFT_508985 [Lophiotrema nucula]
MTTTRTRFEIIFDEAKIRYEKKTKKQLDANLVGTLTTVAEVKAYIEQENSKFVSFRAKNQRIYESLNAAFIPIERLSHVAGSGASVGFPPAGACFGAVAYLIKSAQDVAEHYDKIVQLFETVKVSCVPAL